MSKLKKILLIVIKIILSIFFLWSIINNVFSEESNKSELKSKSCEKYKNDVNFSDKDYIEYCKWLEWCRTNFNPNKIWVNLLKIQVIPFVPNLQIKETQGSDNLLWFYSQYYKDISLGFAPYTTWWPLERARTAYTETQNAIYNCAIIYTKIKVWNNIIRLIPNNSWFSNISKKIQLQNENLSNELKKRNCNEIWNTTIPYNEVLLNNMTFHYCNYRLYLQYLSKFAINNIEPTWWISTKVKSVWQDKYDTNKAMERIKVSKNVVQSEINHIKEVYNMSFNWFNELEATYGSHIMLQFIYDDYVQIRDNLAKLLSPISQLAYKIPHAQKQ